jgi:hypothetical protein
MKKLIFAFILLISLQTKAQCVDDIKYIDALEKKGGLFPSGWDEKHKDSTFSTIKPYYTPAKKHKRKKKWKHFTNIHSTW